MRRRNEVRQKLMIALIPILAIALVFLVKNPLALRAAAKIPGVKPPETAQTVIPNVEIAWTIPAPYELGGRDPMQPVPLPVESETPETPSRPREVPVELILTGIVFSTDRPAAVVDTQVVYEGQQVSGATIKKINKNDVEFEKDGRTWKQTVNK